MDVFGVCAHFHGVRIEPVAASSRKAVNTAQLRIGLGENIAEIHFRVGARAGFEENGMNLRRKRWNRRRQPGCRNRFPVSLSRALRTYIPSPLVQRHAQGEQESAYAVFPAAGAPALS
jgi:hypothetical protein